MPNPEFLEMDDDFTEQPHTASEIIGRGSKTRKSKTFIKDIELASLLGFIDGHSDMLTQLFQRLHAKHFRVPVKAMVDKLDDDGKLILDEDGDPVQELVVEMRPEILTDEQVADRYPVVSRWQRLHMKQVEHFASIDGFSVKAATGMGSAEVSQEARRESSAGADTRRSGQGNVTGNDRWS